MNKISSTETTGIIIHAAMKVHTATGPGLLETAYRTFLTHELRKQGVGVKTEVLLPVTYDQVTLDQAFRIDLLVEDEIIVEVKAAQQLLPVHHSQPDLSAAQ